MAETSFLGRFIQSAGARLRDYHVESRTAFCCFFECQGADLGLAFPGAWEGVNQLHICSTAVVAQSSPSQTHVSEL